MIEKLRNNAKLNHIVRILLMLYFLVVFSDKDSISNITVYILVSIFGLVSYLYLIKVTNLTNIIKNSTKKQKILRISSSIIFGLITIIGNYNLFLDYSIPRKIIMYTLLMLGAMTIFQSILIFCNKKLPFLLTTTNKDIHSVRNFFIFFGIISVIHIFFWLLMGYPAYICSDSLVQIDQALHITPYNNHHPVYHTWLMELFINIFNDTRNGLVAFTGFQLLITSAIFSYALITINLYVKNKIFTIFWLIFYSILPAHITCSFTIYKDVLFSVFVLLMLVSSFRLLQNIGNHIVNIILLSISIIITGLFRSNGLPGLIIFIVLALITYRKTILSYLKWFILPLIIVVILKYPVLNALDIKQHATAEAFSIPMQQITRILIDEGDLTQEQLDYISEIAPIDELKYNYVSWLYDPVRDVIKRLGNQEKLASMKFFKNWFSIVLKNPILAIRAWVDQTSGNWNAYGSTWFAFFSVDLEDEYIAKNNLTLNIVSESVDEFLHHYVDVSTNGNNKILSLLYTTGFYVWILGFCLILALYRNNNNILLLLIIFSILFTLYIANVLSTEFRTAYFIYTCFPICIYSIFNPNIKFNTKIKKNGTNDLNALSK